MGTVSPNYFVLQGFSPVFAGAAIAKHTGIVSVGAAFSHERNGAKTFCGHQNSHYKL